MPSFTILIFLSLLFQAAFSRTLTELVCKINPKRCEDYKNNSFSSRQSPQTVNSIGAPTMAEFQRWNNYEETAQGTGFLKPETGFNQIPYGPGLGDIGITTGVGVQHPFGGLGIERDFGISMGGNGRIGGIPVGWGNGGVRSIGSAPWANP
uniref:Uncharacterized protein n=1 Tax=Caenorhabditis japonica TaxID=281687 RepID=A0A8R1DN78_CAEJA